MPFKDAQARRDYQNERYRRKKLARQKELDKLKELQRKLMFSSLTKDESAIYQVLTEKHADFLEKERQREKKRQFPSDDQDVNMYDHISRDERIIKPGDGSEQTEIQLPRPSNAQHALSKSALTAPIPPTDRLPAPFPKPRCGHGSAGCRGHISGSWPTCPPDVSC